MPAAGTELVFDTPTPGNSPARGGRLRNPVSCISGIFGGILPSLPWGQLTASDVVCRHMKRISVGLAEDTLATLDATRGDVPRERWIRRLIEWSLADPATPQLPEPLRVLPKAENTPHQRGRPHTPGYPLVDHSWVGIGNRCLRVGCEDPSSKEAHL